MALLNPLEYEIQNKNGCILKAFTGVLEQKINDSVLILPATLSRLIAGYAC